MAMRAKSSLLESTNTQLLSNCILKYSWSIEPVCQLRSVCEVNLITLTAKISEWGELLKVIIH